MSSDEEEPTSPVLPKDSDRGSSVSSELQDEYEELLRYAVITPRLETLTSAHLKWLSTSHVQAEGRSAQRRDDSKSQHPADVATEAEHGRPSRSVRSSQPSPSTVEPSTHLKASHAKEMAGPTSSRASAISNAPSDRLQTPTERSRPTSPEALESTKTEIFISDENIGKMENILDTWSDNLKSNVLMELRRWKQVFIAQHKQEIKKEREKYVAETAGLKAELGSLKELLHTYETSNERKDEVIMNLSQVLDRQKEKLKKMRAFTHWRLRHTEAKEEAHADRVAQQHYDLQVKRKVWLGWHSLVQKHWKVKVERACRAKAEEVCHCLSTEYEAKLTEQCEALEKAQVEIQRLRLQRERYEESMKKAFMRGVCALNMEALHMFHITEGIPEQPGAHDQHEPLPQQDEPCSSAMAQLQMFPVAAARLSPVQFEQTGPPHLSAGEDMMGLSAPVSRAEVLPPTSLVHSSQPLGGTVNFHKQLGGRAVTAGQQKPAKTVTARIAARPDSGKTARSNLQVMGVAPPMSSVIVERHHPVTQLTVGQATAAKYPRATLPAPGSTAGRGSAKTHTNSCHVHSIKVVD